MKARGLAAVFIIALCAGVAQAFGRFTYGVLLPAVRDDLQLSNTIAGSLSTVNVGAYLVGTVLVATATSKLKLFTIMRVGLIFSTTGLSLASVSSGVTSLAIAMFLCGLGGACIWIPSPVIAAGALAPERRAFAVGLAGAGIGLGVVFSGQLSGFMRSLSGASSWRTVYLVQATIAVAVTAITFLFVEHKQTDTPTKGGFGGFGALKRLKGWLPITLAYTSFGCMYILVLGFLTTRLEDDSEWTSGRASLAFTILGVAMIFGGPLFMKLVGKFGPRNCLATAFTLWGACCLLVLPGWFSPTLIICAGFGLIFGGIPATITLYFVQNASLADYGPSFAAGTLAFGIGQMVSPQIGGVVADFTGSFTLVISLSAVVAMTGVIFALCLPKQKKPKLAPQLPAFAQPIVYRVTASSK